MPKTVTIRLDENVYEMIKKSCRRERTIANYIEFATMNFTMNTVFVDDAEMNEILAFADEIRKGLSDVSAGKVHHNWLSSK